MPLSVTRARAGFTLIEMLVVIIVIGLLAGLVGPRILGRVSEAKTATARTQIELLGLALDNYRLDNGSYPTTEQGLAALQEKPVREPAASNWRANTPVSEPSPPLIHETVKSPASSMPTVP